MSVSVFKQTKYLTKIIFRAGVIFTWVAFISASFVNIPVANAANIASTDNIDDFLSAYPDLSQIQAALFQRKFTCQQLIAGYMNRIKLYNLTTNNSLAPINAITQLNSQALIEAAQLDTKFQANKIRAGDLFCIPVIVKDNIDVMGLRTSSGSLSLLGTYPLTDSAIVHNIKSKGGIIIAKSAMDEMASGLYGISSLSGRVGNAYITSYNPGGSSSGSAVSVASGFAPLAIGSDNSGSVRIPAAYNGIYGLRPTYGLISHAGIFPAGNLDGTAGSMAGNVNDLAKLLAVMVGLKVDYYSHSLNESSLSGKHFAVIKSVAGKSLWDGMPKPVALIYNNVKLNLQKHGATIIELDLPGYNLERKNNMAGTVDEVNLYLANNISSISQLREICNGNSRVFGTSKQCLKFIDHIKSTNSPEYKQVVYNISRNQVYMSTIMQQYGLDGLILPSGKMGIASYAAENINLQSVIASNSGLPEITLPVAQYHGLPVGLDILGSKYAESALLGYAYAYEKNYYNFKAPKLIADSQFNSWSISKLNTLYTLIGKISFDTIIKPSNHNKITPLQSTIVTNKAVSMMKREL